MEEQMNERLAQAVHTIDKQEDKTDENIEVDLDTVWMLKSSSKTREPR